MPDLPDIPAEVNVNGPTGTTPLTATDYDGIYANGVPIGVAMATSRQLESGNDYLARAAGSSASGAYQVIDTFWNGYGGYERAFLAPPRVQDQFAYERFVEILKQNGNDVSKIPLSWYYPAVLRDPTLMDVVPMPEAGNVLTLREYQARWMRTFGELLGQGSPPFLPRNDREQPYIRSIAFPVLGPVDYINDWQFERDGGRRFHEGTDVIGTAGQPLRAAVDGVVTRVRYSDEGTAGVALSITAADGHRYNYFHINDRAAGGFEWARLGFRVHPDLFVGAEVKAGQVIAYMGDSGNARGIPHLHFEIRDPDGNPMNPYPSLVAAQQREQCSTGIGPWSTFFLRPVESERRGLRDRSKPRMVETSPARKDRPSTIAERKQRDPGSVWQIVGPDGARWTITADGDVRASGAGALIAPSDGECDVVPEGRFGTAAGGMALDELPQGWIDRRVDRALAKALGIETADDVDVHRRKVEALGVDTSRFWIV